MNLDGDKFYSKFVDLDEMYNCLVKIFIIWNHICVQIIWTLHLNIVCIIWAWRLFEMEISELKSYMK
jgi:hypothetical protein